jgi:hypothetical protein
MRTLEDLIARVAVSVDLEVNMHRTYYETLDGALEGFARDDSHSPESIASCRASGNVYALQFYPDTPIGFYCLIGGTLAEVVERAHVALDEEGKP